MRFYLETFSGGTFYSLCCCQFVRVWSGNDRGWKMNDHITIKEQCERQPLFIRHATGFCGVDCMFCEADRSIQRAINSQILEHLEKQIEEMDQLINRHYCDDKD